VEERDAIIIGGGPAGAVAAWRLAVAGWRVVLVERRPDGAAKCCGHCLHPEAFLVLDAMGVGDAVRRASVGQTRRGRVVVGHDREVLNTPFAAEGLVVPRRTFDAILRTAAACAGADVRTEVGATIASLDASGAVVHLRASGAEGASVETLRAALLVGADGCGSAVARAAGLVDGARVGRKFGVALDVALEVGGASAARERIARQFDETITMFVVDGGYLGVVREGRDRLHCGALVAADAPMPTKPREALGWFIERSASLAELIGPAWESRVESVVASGPMPWRTRARTTDRVALVGDAAGYIEPFTGEGMRWAIDSGWMLGEAIGDGVWDAGARQRYEQAWTRGIAPMHSRCERVAAIAGTPRVLSGVGAARHWMPAMIRGLGDRAIRPIVRALVPR
jgi:menaquinone-9 beta-reductase